MLLWFKALHLIFVIAWFAGMFYIFRLLVYQVENRERPDLVHVLRVMAERLQRVIMTPAMLGAFVFGLGMLVLNPSYLELGWLRLKLVLLLGLLGYHHHAGAVRRRFERGDYYLTPRQCRIRNEIPSVFLVAIVLLAVLRPQFS